MKQAGYSFSKTTLKNRGKPGSKNYREGWVSHYGWDKALELHLAVKGQAALTSAESLLFEVEYVRKKLYHALKTQGVVNNRDLVYQHDKYVARTTDVLSKLEAARDNFGNFIYFLQHLSKASTLISPDLAHALVDAEDAVIDWAENQFGANLEEDEDENGE